jgi:hypothetical protein
MLLSFAVVLLNFVKLVGIHDPGHRYLYNHVWQMVRIGSFDVNFAFAMDPLSAGDVPHHHGRRHPDPRLRRVVHGERASVLALLPRT